MVVQLFTRDQAWEDYTRLAREVSDRPELMSDRDHQQRRAVAWRRFRSLRRGVL